MDKPKAQVVNTCWVWARLADFVASCMWSIHQEQIPVLVHSFQQKTSYRSATWKTHPATQKKNTAPFEQTRERYHQSDSIAIYHRWSTTQNNNCSPQKKSCHDCDWTKACDNDTIYSKLDTTLHPPAHITFQTPCHHVGLGTVHNTNTAQWQISQNSTWANRNTVMSNPPCIRSIHHANCSVKQMTCPSPES